jgi:hypothetical protein
MRHLDYCEIRLVKYTKLIDKAIASKRYGLSTQLAYRCLLEYNRLFMRFCIPSSKSLKKNAFQLSIEVVRYFRKSPDWFTFKRSRQMLAMLRTTYYLTKLSSMRFADRDLHLDLATATYARDQSLAIARFLFGSVRERTIPGTTEPQDE